MKHQVKVEWNFAPKPEPIPLQTLRNGQQIALGVMHEFRPEGIPTTQIWCFGCRQYFPSWHHALWRHGMCEQKPGEPMPKIVAKPPVVLKKKKNDRVPIPDMSTWSVQQMKVWINKHRPENYNKLFGGA